MTETVAPPITLKRLSIQKPRPEAQIASGSNVQAIETPVTETPTAISSPAPIDEKAGLLAYLQQMRDSTQPRGDLTAAIAEAQTAREKRQIEQAKAEVLNEPNPELLSVLEDREDLRAFIERDLLQQRDAIKHMMEQLQVRMSKDKTGAVKRRYDAVVRILEGFGHSLERINQRESVAGERQEYNTMFHEQLMHVEDHWEELKVERRKVKNEAGKEVEEDFMVVKFGLKDWMTVHVPGEKTNAKMQQWASDVKEFLSMRYEYTTNGLAEQPMWAIRKLTPQDRERFNKMRAYDSTMNPDRLRTGISPVNETERRQVNEIFRLDRLVRKGNKYHFGQHGWSGDHTVMEEYMYNSVQDMEEKRAASGDENDYDIVGIIGDGMGINGNRAADEFVGLRHGEPVLTSADYSQQMLMQLQMMGVLADEDASILYTGWSKGGEGVVNLNIAVLDAVEAYLGRPLQQNEKIQGMADLKILSFCRALEDSCRFLRPVRGKLTAEGIKQDAYSLLSRAIVEVGLLAKAAGLTEVQGTKQIIAAITYLYTSKLLPEDSPLVKFIGTRHADIFLDKRNLKTIIDETRGLLEYDGISQENLKRLGRNNIPIIEVFAKNDRLTDCEVQVATAAKELKAGFNPIKFELSFGHSLPVSSEILDFPFYEFSQFSQEDMVFILEHALMLERLTAGMDLEAEVQEHIMNEFTEASSHIPSTPLISRRSSSPELKRHAFKAHIYTIIADRFAGDPQMQKQVLTFIQYLDSKERSVYKQVQKEAVEKPKQNSVINYPLPDYLRVGPELLQAA